MVDARYETWKLTPLEQVMEGQGRPTRPTPDDALRIGRHRFLCGEPIEMGALARNLGVSRATVYRWVGDKDRYISQVIWSLASDTLSDALRRTEDGRVGAEWVVAVLDRFVRSLMDDGSLSVFVRRDPEYALRILTGPASIVRQRATETVADLLAAQVDQAQPSLPLDTLAYLIVRVIESFLYSDVIAGATLDIDNALIAVRLLLREDPASLA